MTETFPRLDLDNPFWQFSLKVYAYEGLAPLCLQLQDDFGFDVNLLLLAVFCDAQHLDLQTEGWRELLVAVQPLQQAVVSARALRRSLKPESSNQQDLHAKQYKAAKQHELYLEQVMQALLFETIEPLYLRSKACHNSESNLAHYQRELNRLSQSGCESDKLQDLRPILEQFKELIEKG